jgi:hypothetical protein
LFTGVPPLALLKCLQSGDSQTSATGWLFVTLIGSTSHTLSHRCFVCGWLMAYSQRFGIVVDGDINWPAEGGHVAGAGATATCKIVDDHQ